MKPMDESPTQQIIVEFFDELYGPQAPGYLALWTKDPRRTIWTPGKDLIKAGQVALKLVQARKDVYFGLGLQPNDLGPQKRGKAAQVIAIPGVWADIDIADPAHKAPNLPLSLKEAQSWLAEVCLPPTVTVNSGHGLHTYWLFPELWVFQNAEEHQKGKALVQAFQGQLIRLAKQHGWTRDNTSDLARVLRVPGTMNYKLEPIPVSIIEQDYARRYTLAEFEEWVTDSIEPQAKPKGTTVKASTEEEHDWPPADPVPIVEGCAWIRHCQEDVKTLAEPEWYAMLSIVGRCENGAALAQEWSAPYPNYSVEETETKLQQALTQGGPRTCQNIQEMTGGDYCEECQYSKAITSPIVLGHSFAQSGFNKALIHNPVAELNKTHAVIMNGGKCRILNEACDPHTGYTIISFSSERDFELRYKPYQKLSFKDGKPQWRPISNLWLHSAKRRQYEGMVFSPQKETPGFYNLWQGFAVEPKEGDCGLFLEHIRNNIAGGKQEYADYILQWMAHIVQHPEQRVGVAIVLQGRQGTGKSLMCKLFGSLFGPHYALVTSSRGLVGNFNAHLRDVVVLFADEAFWAGDRASEGSLKAMITEDTLPIEAKGQDVITAPNHLNIMMASNNEWVVPAGLEERRFCVFNVGEDHMQDASYFKALIEQMENGGQQALLHYLIHYKLAGVNLQKFPQTEALLEQKIHSLNDVQKFWLDKLMSGVLADDLLTLGKGYVHKDELYNEYIEHAQKQGHTRRSGETKLGIGIRKLVPDLQERTIPRPKSYVGEKNPKETRDQPQKIANKCWIFPNLQKCREAFARQMNYPFKWPDDAEDWRYRYRDIDDMNNAEDDVY